MSNNGKEGFVDYKPLEEVNVCGSPEHLPPTMILLGLGKYTYKCLLCQKITVVNIPKLI